MTLHAGSGGVVDVRPVERQVALIDTVEAPRCARLGVRQAHALIGLDPEKDMVLWNPQESFGGTDAEKIKSSRVMDAPFAT